MFRIVLICFGLADFRHFNFSSAGAKASFSCWSLQWHPALCGNFDHQQHGGGTDCVLRATGHGDLAGRSETTRLGVFRNATYLQTKQCQSTRDRHTFLEDWFFWRDWLLRLKFGSTMADWHMRLETALQVATLRAAPQTAQARRKTLEKTEAQNYMKPSCLVDYAMLVGLESTRRKCHSGTLMFVECHVSCFRLHMSKVFWSCFVMAWANGEWRPTRNCCSASLRLLQWHLPLQSDCRDLAYGRSSVLQHCTESRHGRMNGINKLLVTFCNLWIIAVLLEYLLMYSQLMFFFLVLVGGISPVVKWVLESGMHLQAWTGCLQLFYREVGWEPWRLLDLPGYVWGCRDGNPFSNNPHCKACLGGTHLSLPLLLDDEYFHSLNRWNPGLL